MESRLNQNGTIIIQISSSLSYFKFIFWKLYVFMLKSSIICNSLDQKSRKIIKIIQKSHAKFNDRQISDRFSPKSAKNCFLCVQNVTMWDGRIQFLFYVK